MLQTTKVSKKIISQKLIDQSVLEVSPIKNEFINFKERVLSWIPKTRTSNPLSKLLRPVFERRGTVHKALGTQFAALIVAIGALSLPTSTLGVVAVDASQFGQIDVPVVTNKTITYPVAEALGISQGFSIFHPGVDIRSPLGTAIYPIAAGKVSLVMVERGGYGRHVEVTHENGTVSLYAHMGKIFVEEGDLVTTSTTLGEVGITGHTTGPHLHLEIHKDGKTINPLSVI